MRPTDSKHIGFHPWDTTSGTTPLHTFYIKQADLRQALSLLPHVRLRAKLPDACESAVEAHLEVKASSAMSSCKAEHRQVSFRFRLLLRN